MVHEGVQRVQVSYQGVLGLTSVYLSGYGENSYTYLRNMSPPVTPNNTVIVVSRFERDTS